jgi:hypothetical protein
MGCPTRRTSTKVLVVQHARCKTRRDVGQREQGHVERALVELAERRLELADEVANPEVDARRLALQLLQKPWQQHRGHRVRRANDETPHRVARIELLGARNHLARALEDVGHRHRKLACAFRRDHALRLPQEQRVLHQLAQAAESMAHGRGRHVQARGRARHVAFFEHRLEQHQQVEVDPREISLVQHMAEIVSLDSAWLRD